jgi:dolichyl-phosphate beta-glucosyltransferase
MTSVVFPCRDEADRIVPTLERTIEFLTRRNRDWEVLVVDDGSSDHTGDLVRDRFGASPGVRVLRYETNHGKGFAVREGVLASRGDPVLFSDADLSTPIAELTRLEAKLDEGFDLVVGSRGVPGARILTPQPLRRRISGLVFRALVRGLGLSTLNDTQCGFKLMRRGTVEPVLRRIDTLGFAFDVELVARCERSGLRVVEVPVDWYDARGSKVRLFPDALHMAADLVRIRRRMASVN